MAKSFKCADAGVICNATVTGETEEEVLRKAVEHAREAHGVDLIQSSTLEWTIVRPGRLTDDPGTGRVRIDTLPHRSEVAREEVAAVLDAVLHEPRAARAILYVNGGRDNVVDALRNALDRS